MKMVYGKVTKPEWAARIEGLREDLKLSQAGLAKRLSVSPMAPSRWERGINEPAPDTYLQLGKLAGDPGCWYFWERAGLSRGDVNQVLTAGSGRISVAVPPDSSRKGQAAAAKPKLAPSAKSGTPEFVLLPVVDLALEPSSFDSPLHLESLPVKQMLSAPRSWCPHPDQTIYVEIHSGAMAPMLKPGDFVSLDTTSHNPGTLRNKQVGVLYPTEGVLVGILRDVGRIQELVLQSRTEALPLQGVRIIGRVLWWIGRPR